MCWFFSFFFFLLWLLLFVLVLLFWSYDVYVQCLLNSSHNVLNISANQERLFNNNEMKRKKKHTHFVYLVIHKTNILPSSFRTFFFFLSSFEIQPANRNSFLFRVKVVPIFRYHTRAHITFANFPSSGHSFGLGAGYFFYFFVIFSLWFLFQCGFSQFRPKVS